MILIISHAGDDHACAVHAALERRQAPVHLLDLADFPRQMQLAVQYGDREGHRFSLDCSSSRDLDLSACQVVWWRRPQPFKLHEDLRDGAYRSFAYNEGLEAWAGTWQSLDAFWINPPLRDEAAGRKVYQLRVAQEVGLEIPPTLITNNPTQAADFIAQCGVTQTIFKSFSATEHAWRETRLLRAEELAQLDSVKYAPLIFQQFVPAQFDLRITVIDEKFFVSQVYSQETTYQVDYRMELAQARVVAGTLPPEVRQRLRALMQRLGLIYGAIDMRLTPDGRYVFLEVNPAGQWLFMEERTGQPITEYFAQFLCERHQEACSS